MDEQWIEWYYAMCDNYKSFYPALASSDEHFDLAVLSEEDLRRCCCKPQCSHATRDCLAYRNWKRSFLREEENHAQLDLFCAESDIDASQTWCREVILWIWFRLAQIKEKKLSYRLDESVKVMEDNLI